MPKIKKAEMHSVEHPEYRLHTFESLARVVGTTKDTIADMYGRGDFSVVVSKLTKCCNMLCLTAKEEARLVAMFSGWPKKPGLTLLRFKSK